MFTKAASYRCRTDKPHINAALATLMNKISSFLRRVIFWIMPSSAVWRYQIKCPTRQNNAKWDWRCSYQRTADAMMKAANLQRHDSTLWLAWILLNIRDLYKKKKEKYFATCSQSMWKRWELVKDLSCNRGKLTSLGSHYGPTKRKLYGIVGMTAEVEEMEI